MAKAKATGKRRDLGIDRWTSNGYGIHVENAVTQPRPQNPQNQNKQNAPQKKG